MRLTEIEAFRAVMETGTIAGAAQRIRRTPPQVSRLIAEFERGIGLSLFRRERKRLKPTIEGREFFRHCVEILGGIEDIPAVVRRIRGLKEPHLRIGCQPYVAEALLPAAIAEFRRQEPSFRFSIEVLSRADIGRVEELPRFDLAIAALPIEHDLPVRCRPFAHATLVALVPASHRLARGKREVAAADLAREPFIALTGNNLLRKEVDRTFLNLGIQLDIVGEASIGSATRQLVACGLGVTLTDPLEAVLVSPEKVSILDVMPAMSFTYGFVDSTTAAPSELAMSFSDCVAATAHKLDPAHIRLL